MVISKVSQCSSPIEKPKKYFKKPTANYVRCRSMRCFINIGGKFQWSISIINVFEYNVGCIGQFHLSSYHLFNNLRWFRFWGPKLNYRNQKEILKLSYRLFHKLSFGGSNKETLIILDVYWNISGITTFNAFDV